MRKIYLAFTLFAATIFFSSGITDESDSCGDGSRKSAGPPSCYAGEPPGFTTCASGGCHDDSPLNSGIAQLNLNLGGADTNYIPGQQYTITVSLTRAGLVRGGFQIIALQDSNISTSPGIITLSEPLRTQLIDAAHPHPGPCATQSKVWVEHTAAGIDNVLNDTIQWQYNWQAPATNVGSITFYVAGIDANNDQDNTGDFTYTTSKTITSFPVGIQTFTKSDIRIFPNPAGGFIYIETTRPFSVSIVNMLGETLHRQKANAMQPIDVSNFNSGIYFIKNDETGETVKFIKE